MAELVCGAIIEVTAFVDYPANKSCKETTEHVTALKMEQQRGEGAPCTLEGLHVAGFIDNQDPFCIFEVHHMTKNDQFFIPWQMVIVIALNDGSHEIVE